MSDALQNVAAPSSPAACRSDVWSYGLVSGSFLLFATAAPLVAWADAPAGFLRSPAEAVVHADPSAQPITGPRAR